MLSLKQYEFSDSDDEESTSTANCVSPPNAPPSANGSSPAPNLTDSTSKLEAGWKNSSRATGARGCNTTVEDGVAKRVNVADSSEHYANQNFSSVASISHRRAQSISMNSTPVKGILKLPKVSDEVPVLQTIMSQGKIAGRFVVKKLSPRKLKLSDTEKPKPDSPEKSVSPPPVPATCGLTMEEAKGEILYKKSLALARHAGIYLPPPMTTVESPIPCKKVKQFSPDVPMKKPLPSMSARAQNNQVARKKQRISKKTFGLTAESPEKPQVKLYWDGSPEPDDKPVSTFQNKISGFKKTDERLENVGYHTGGYHSNNMKKSSEESLTVGKSVLDSSPPEHSADSSNMPIAEASEQSAVTIQLKKQEDIIIKMSQNMESLKNYNAKLVDSLKDLSSLLKKLSQKKHAE